jgi:hypothetical protein
MCFSANASFVVSSGLIGIGVATINKIKHKFQIPFSIIPVLFSFQQLTEGVLWLSLTTLQFNYLQELATFTFLIFAQVIWPIWVPASIWLLEKNNLRKKILFALLFTGIMVSAYLFYSLINYNIESKINNHHISYLLAMPKLIYVNGGVLYFMVTVIPPFISSIKKMNFLGIILLISYLFTKLVFHEFIISVWCFFASIISLMVLYINFNYEKEFKQNFKLIE